VFLARIAGVDIPRNKRVIIALMYIYGIGKSTSGKILQKCNVNPDKRVQELTDEETKKIRTIISTDYKVEGTLRAEVSMNIKRLMDISCYRGLRHKKGLPVRGQRSKTNARTRKGRKKTIGAKRKKK